MDASEHYTDEWTPLNPVILEAHCPQSDAVVAAICTPQQAIVGSWQSVSLQLTLGADGLRQGDAIVVQSATRGLQSWPALQHLMPAEAGYSSAASDSGSRVTCLVVGPHVRVIAAEPLPAGDILRISYGDQSAGGPGVRMTLAALRHWFRILLTPQDGSATREVVAEPPYLDLLPDAPESLDVLAPSHMRRGEKSTFVIKAVDAHGNTARPPAEPSIVSPIIGVECPGDVQLNERDRAARHIDLVLTEEMPPAARLRLRVRHSATKGIGISNAVEVLPSGDDSDRVYWGDLHAHTSHGHAYGEIEDLYHYARDEARLDFVAHVEHYTRAGEWLHPWWRRRYPDCHTVAEFVERSWQERLEQARRFDDPGKFVPLLGLEWAHTTGHLNGFFPSLEAPLVYPTSFRDPAMTPAHLKGLLKDQNWFGVPHHTAFPLGRGTLGGFRWEHFDPETMPCVEIASKQGNGEYFGAPHAALPMGVGGTVREGLARGLRFGFVGATDTNIARPGSFTAQEKRQRLPGLTAVFAPALEREAIYNAIRKRRCYATFGGRPILRFTINGAFMGESLHLPRADAVKHIVCDVAGSAELARVEVIKNGETFFQFVTTDMGSHNRTYDFREEFPDTAPSQAGDYYYLRIQQCDGALAWSSPIWIDL
ncbi:MAG: DUF3604 domain-containing protein [Chloroflexi bacterium]|nr:DUF3604 domain-containing protein [Chloroflexota bacterium]